MVVCYEPGFWSSNGQLRPNTPKNDILFYTFVTQFMFRHVYVNRYIKVALFVDLISTIYFNFFANF